MDKILKLVDFVKIHMDVIAAIGLFVVSEAMALIPSVKSNSVAQWILAFFKKESEAHPQVLEQK